MKKSKILIIVTLLNLIFDASKAVTWVQKANCPFSRRDACAFEFNGKACISTGFGGSYTKSTFAFTPSVNSWYSTLLPDIPGDPRANCVCGGNNSYGYLALGKPLNFYTNDMFRLNSSTLSWGGSSPTFYSNVIGAADAIGVVVGNDFFVGTGISSGIVSYETSFWKYDNSWGGWTQKADVPGPGRKAAFAFNLNNTVYVGGGSSYPSTALSDFYSFDDVANIWTTLPSLPGGGREDAVAFAIGSNGYVGLGNDISGTTLTLYPSFLQYNAVTQSWSSIGNIPTVSRYGAVGVALNGKGYVGLGITATNVYKNDWWELTPTVTGINETSEGLSTVRLINQELNNKVLLTGFNNKQYHISLHDITGKKIFVKTHKSNEDFEINTSALAKASYLVTVSTEKESKGLRFIKN